MIFFCFLADILQTSCACASSEGAQDADVHHVIVPHKGNIFPTGMIPWLRQVDIKWTRSTAVVTEAFHEIYEMF